LLCCVRRIGELRRCPFRSRVAVYAAGCMLCNTSPDRRVPAVSPATPTGRLAEVPHGRTSGVYRAHPPLAPQRRRSNADRLGASTKSVLKRSCAAHCSRHNPSRALTMARGRASLDSHGGRWRGRACTAQGSQVGTSHGERSESSVLPQWHRLRRTGGKRPQPSALFRRGSRSRRALQARRAAATGGRARPRPAAAVLH
jgi:hypothetical protein